MAQMSVEQAVSKLIELMQAYEPRKAILAQLQGQGIRVDEVAEYHPDSFSLNIRSVLKKGGNEMVVESAIYQDLNPKKEMEGHYALMQDALFKNIQQLLK